MKNTILTRLSILLINLLIWIPFDQWTKNWAVDELKFRPSISYLGGMVKFIYAENRGAWGSLGSTWQGLPREVMLIYLPIMALLFFAGYMVFGKKVKLFEAVGLSLIVSGGVGNLIDRVMLGYVVDFLWMGFNRTLGTNIFNIADVVIMAGFFILIIPPVIEFFQKKKINGPESQLDQSPE